MDNAPHYNLTASAPFRKQSMAGLFVILALCLSPLWNGAARAQNLNWAAQQAINGVGSSVGPSMATFKSRLFAAWKGIDGDQDIYWSSFGPGGWAAQQTIVGIGSSHGPSLAVFQNQLFAAWKGRNSNQNIYWSSFDGSNWAPQQRIANVGSSIGPSLAMFGNRLFAAWKGVDDDQGIYWSSFDGSDWAPQQKIANVGSSHGPSLAAFENGLIAVWKGIGSDQDIYWSIFSSGTWTPQRKIAGVGSSVGPSLAVFANRLFASWKGIGGHDGIYWSSLAFDFDTGTWALQQRINGVGSSHGPSLAVFENRLFAAWKGIGGDQGIYFSSASAIAATPESCAFCNDGSCRCGTGSSSHLCTGHGGFSTEVGCSVQP
jgi:hypothetical protein